MAELDQSRGRQTRFGFRERADSGQAPDGRDGDNQRERAPTTTTATPRPFTSRRRLRPRPGQFPADDLRATWQAMEAETGWRPAEALLPYAQLVRYRHVSHEDAKEGTTWVDIVGADGKPLRRNVGLLRYYGGVAFTSDDSAWAGIMLQGVRMAGVENDGRVGEIRYFACPRGQGLFVPERFVRRSFVQRAPQPHQAFAPPTTSRIPRPRFYSSGAPVPDAVQDVDSLEALLYLPPGSLGPTMANARAGVIFNFAPPPARVVKEAVDPRSAKAAAKMQLFQEMHATITGEPLITEPGLQAAAATGAGDLKDEGMGATSSTSAGSTLTTTGMVAVEDLAGLTGSSATASWGRGGEGQEQGEEERGAFLQTQTFGRSAPFSIGSRCASLSSSTGSRSSSGSSRERGRAEVVDLVQEALHMAAAWGQQGGLAPITQALAATAMTAAAWEAQADVDLSGIGVEAEVEAEAEAMDRAAMYFEVAARFLENLAATLEVQRDDGTGSSLTCLQAALMGGR